MSSVREISCLGGESNHRTQINNVLRRTSYPELVRTMKSKSATESEPEAVMASPATVDSEGASTAPPKPPPEHRLRGWSPRSNGGQVSAWV
jgi:hypothetical protein